MNKKIWIWLWAGIGLILCVIIFWPVDRGVEEAILDAEEVEEVEEVVDSTEAQQEHYKYGIPADNFEIEEGTVARGQNLSMILDKYGVSSKKIHEISQRSKDVFDLRKIRSGQNYTLFLAKDSLRTPEFFIYESNKVEYVVVDFKDTTNVYLGAKDIVKRDSAVKVGISSSLWNAFSDAGVDPNLAIVLSEIYAWTIDFYGIAKGDSVRVLYEQSYVEDKPLADYTIKGAIFTNGGTSFYAIPFEQNEKISYFDFSDPKSRVIFFDKETLDKIAVYLGSCVFADCITTTILKNELLCLSQAIGSSVYKFVMEHGRYAFGGTVKRHYSSKRDVKLVLQETKYQGYSILVFFAGSLSKNYQDFLLRKIAELDVEFEKQQQWSLDQDKLFSLICFIAINEIDGKWKKYFI